MGKIKDMSIKKTFIALTFVTLIVDTLFTVFSFWSLEAIRSNILAKYYSTYNNTTLNPSIFLVDPNAFSKTDQRILQIIEYLKLGLPSLFFVVSVIATAYIFYNSKLKTPITLLKDSAKKISCNDLNFTIAYDSKDEMGDLCTAFEKMRKQLLNNNISMWRMMEERKRLNATFAHDLRTPITVLKGYTGILESYFPTGKISQEKLLSTVSLMSDNVVRLEKYVDTMNNVQKLEDMDIYPVEVETLDFINKLESNLRILSEEQGKSFMLNNHITSSSLFLDEKVIFRVIENIAANAFRYAQKSVYVDCSKTQALIVFEITDDGKGFSPEDLKLATEPFYRNKNVTDSNHLGLGLNISKILCQKHEGSLTLANAEDGGAKVTATFSLNVDKK